MRVLVIDGVCGTGSTGKIACGIAEQYESEGHELRVAYGRKSFVPEKYRHFAVRIGTMKDVYIHALITRLTDRHGFFPGVPQKNSCAGRTSTILIFDGFTTFTATISTLRCFSGG